MLAIERRAEAAQATPARARELTSHTLKAALPGGGAAVQSLKRAAHDPYSSPARPPSPGDPGGVFAAFMVQVQRDVQRLAAEIGAGCTQAQAAESMRQAVVDGRIGAELDEADRARLIYALHGVREAAQGRDVLEAELRAAPSFRRLPGDQAWRMLMDASAWGDGRHGGLRFENEPGYMGGMYQGLAAMLAGHRQGRRLDAAFLAQLHDTATAGVLQMQAYRQAWFDSAVRLTRPERPNAESQAYGSNGPRLEAGYRADGVMVRFGLLPGQNMTRAGLKELLDSHARQSPEPDGNVYLHDPENPKTIKSLKDWDGKSGLVLVARPMSPRASAAKADEIIGEARRAQRHATSEGAKLAAIAQCVQRLEQAHLFSDGNARTTGYLVLNKLLLETGLQPAMIEDPNRFDGHAIAELVQEIRNGQQRYAAHLSLPAAH